MNNRRLSMIILGVVVALFVVGGLSYVSGRDQGAKELQAMKDAHQKALATITDLDREKSAWQGAYQDLVEKIRTKAAQRQGQTAPKEPGEQVKVLRDMGFASAHEEGRK